MRFVILGDTHWGCRNDLPLFYGHFEEFYDSLISFLLENQITDVFQLGDLFDRRKYINFKTLKESKRILFDRLRDYGITLHVLVGNHDIHMKESVEINSPSLVLGEYNNIRVYTKPTMITVHNTTIDIIPWICTENQQEVMSFIDSSSSDLCFGHFEIATFTMYRGGDEVHEGLPLTVFEKYELVCSGHYHTRSTKHNITYVGTPYEMTWQDFNDPKGFHVFDTETRKLTFHENPSKVFVRLDYDEKSPIDLRSLDLRSRFIKVVVTNKTDLYKFDSFIQTLYTKGCYDIKIIENLADLSETELDEETDLEDTLDVLSNYIDSVDVGVDTALIKQYMRTLYTEALNHGSD